MKKYKDQNLVYSTESGRICPKCGNPVKKCNCATKKTPSPSTDGIVRISRQTKGRKGSGVCLITGIPLGNPELKTLTKQLKKKCGSGGTLNNGVIEIQGDHRGVLLDTLTNLGYKVKIAGG